MAPKYFKTRKELSEPAKKSDNLEIFRNTTIFKTEMSFFNGMICNVR